MRRALAAATLFVSACADPVNDRRVEQLGPEDPRVPAGPLHRPGQPCGVCHDGDGPAEDDYALAGTVFRTQAAADPMPDAVVRVIDSTGAQRSAITNCAGNFWIERADFEPVWPVWVKLVLGDETVEMRSAISRESSCAGCHEEPASASTVGRVYFFAGADAGASTTGGESCP